MNNEEASVGVGNETRFYNLEPNYVRSFSGLPGKV